MTILHLLTYLVLLFFLILIIKRAIKIMTAPVHLRWELYPVPHEKGRAHYGGSRLEERESWGKETEKDMFNEAKEMLTEIILLRGVWEHNKKLWFGSFPLHFGLYLLIVNMAALFVAGILSVGGTAITHGAEGFAGFLASLITLLTWAGGILGFIGSVVMLFLRSFDRSLSTFATPSHYFNIILLGAIYISAIGWVSGDTAYTENLSGLYAGLMSFSDLPYLGTWGYVHFSIVLFFLFYLPMTHMTHFFTKYFTYHKVRWEDEPNVAGGKIEKQIAKQLQYPVSWAAPHIGADGTKTWLAIATESQEEEKNDK